MKQVRLRNIVGTYCRLPVSQKDLVPLLRTSAYELRYHHHYYSFSIFNRSKVLLDLDGGRTLLGLLRSLLHAAESRSALEVGLDPALSEAEAGLCGETLKALFNVTLGVEELLECADTKEQAEEAVRSACATVRDLLAVSVQGDQTAKRSLHSNCVNLLNNAPPRLASQLLEAPSASIVSASFVPCMYEGVCVDAPKVMLDLLLENAKEVSMQDIHETNRLIGNYRAL